MSKFDLVKVLGHGTYGVVFLSKLKRTSRPKYALKFLIPTTSRDAYSEIKSLQMLGKHENVIDLLSSVRYLDQIVLVFPYFKHHTFIDLLGSADLLDIRCYIHSLLKGLSYIHSKRIVHRDIKPANFLYNKEDRIGKIIDFGLSEVSTCERSSHSCLVFHNPLMDRKKNCTCTYTYVFP